MSDAPTVIITGAGSGIGAATAKRFARDGYNTVLNGRTREKLESIASEIEGDRVKIVAGDVSKVEDVDALVAETLDAFGRLDVLVNNAGIARGGRPGKLSRDDFQKMQDINVGGIFNTVTAALPHLKKSKGSIVNVSSVSGLGGDWGMFGYNTSKGGVSLMTKGMALDLAGEGVCVNAVAPSLTRTDMADGIMDDDGLLERFLHRIPMGRPGEPEDVADVIAFLASRDARFVTGVVLPVDGGVSASNGQPQLG